MKNKIFDKMKEYGWKIGDNTNEDFNMVYDYHYDNLDNWYNYISEKDYTMQDISKSEFSDFVVFMSDFLRAFNEIDKKGSEDRMNDYKIDFLELVKDRMTFLFEDNEVDKENKPSEEVIRKIAKAVASDSELWSKIEETIDYWYEQYVFKGFGGE